MRLIDADALIDAINKWMPNQEEFMESAIPPIENLAVSVLMTIEEQPTVDAEPRWIPFKARDLTDEEKEEHPEWCFIFDGKLPEDGQRILVSIDSAGHERVQLDEFYEDFGIYLDSGYEMGREAVAWMPLPKPYQEEKC